MQKIKQSCHPDGWPAGRPMKTIKVYIEGGVCTDVVIPEEYHGKLNYEVIDYDNLDAIEDEIKEAAEKNENK